MINVTEVMTVTGYNSTGTNLFFKNMIYVTEVMTVTGYIVQKKKACKM
jgi:hypothetical protein